MEVRDVPTYLRGTEQASRGFGKFPSGSNYSKCLPLEDE